MRKLLLSIDTDKLRKRNVIPSSAEGSQGTDALHSFREIPRRASLARNDWLRLILSIALCLMLHPLCARAAAPLDPEGLAKFEKLKTGLYFVEQVVAEQGSGRLSRFAGSAYDGTLVIGGPDHPKQFGFCDQIDPGAAITLTDMTGGQLSYTVVRVDRREQADAGWLQDPEYDLTLFCRDTLSMTCIAVRCQAKP